MFRKSKNVRMKPKRISPEDLTLFFLYISDNACISEYVYYSKMIRSLSIQCAKLKHPSEYYVCPKIHFATRI